MEKTLAKLSRIVLFRSKSDEEEELSQFEKRLKKVNRAREYNAAPRGPGFKNPQTPSKA
jgi:hypothetical protein